MTRRVIGVLLLALGGVVSWVLGYLRVPYIKNDNIFWITIIACCCVFVIGISLVSVFTKNSFLKTINNGNTEQINTLDHSKPILNTVLGGILILGLIGLSIFNFFNTRSLQQGLKKSELELQNLKASLDIEQQRNNIGLIQDLINSFDSLRSISKDSVKVNQFISHIQTLGSSFVVHNIWDPEYKMYHNISPEKGLLLLSIVGAKLDTQTFNNIKRTVSFRGADLRNADFSGLDFSGIDLQYANLDRANLQRINLNNARLTGASMIHVNLNNASLVGANLIATKMHWSKVSDADMRFIKLDSAEFTNALAQRSSLKKASMIHTDISNSNFANSDLNDAVLMYTKLTNANFSNADITEADFYFSHVDELNLKNAKIHKDWKIRLTEKDNKGVETVFNRYQVITDSISYQDSLIIKLQ